MTVFSWGGCGSLANHGLPGREIPQVRGSQANHSHPKSRDTESKNWRSHPESQHARRWLDFVVSRMLHSPLKRSGQIAQLVEHRTENPGVGSSTLPLPTRPDSSRSGRPTPPRRGRPDLISKAGPTGSADPGDRRANSLGDRLRRGVRSHRRIPGHPKTRRSASALLFSGNMTLELLQACMLSTTIVTTASTGANRATRPTRTALRARAEMR